MNITVILGTRPEAIKLAPVILALKADKRFKCRVCVTGQHRQMVDQILPIFEIIPDVNLNLMSPGQTLESLTAKAIVAIGNELRMHRPDAVIVQGDTTTVFVGALAAFYEKIPVAHVEAGLRTGDLFSPWPEEANRLLTSRLAQWHFAPTERSKKNLLQENIPEETIYVTGNTVIDALHMVVEKVQKNPPRIKGIPTTMLQNTLRQMVLITGHRRENFGDGFKSICEAIITLVTTHPNVDFIYPVHLNPNVRTPVAQYLGTCEAARFPNLYLIEPQGYLEFIALMQRSTIILTDSGGVQEEAPGLGKPVLVMRDTTERPEAVEAGGVCLVGTDKNAIINWVGRLLNDDVTYKRMAQSRNPYGDGRAALYILEALITQ